MMMMLKLHFIVALVASLAHTFVSAQVNCIANLTHLTALQDARGKKTSKSVTYILCPNTVYVPTDYELFELSGNATYLCGTSGASSNNCIVRGGSFQLSIALYAWNFAPKDNILISGFTFEQAELGSGSIAAPGRYTIRDCFFKNHNNHGVLDFVYYIPPTVRRELSSVQENRKSQRDDFVRFLTDPHLQLERLQSMDERSLQTVARTTVLFDRCQFLNNTMTTNVTYPTLLHNGPLAILSLFADVTVNECAFKDNFFEFRRDYERQGYGIYVESGAALDISKSCFIDDFIDGYGPTWVRSKSSLISSINNYVRTSNPLSPCAYLFTHESFKCKAPESTVCLASPCDVVFKVYNVRTQSAVATLTNSTTITAPPCNINIEAILPCVSSGTKLGLDLLKNGVLVRQRQEVVDRRFLFGNVGSVISSGTMAAGTYTIRAIVNGVVQPKPITFTLSGTCVP